MVSAFDARRRVVVEALNQLPGVTCTLPGGAFYAFPNVTGSGWGDKALATALLEEAGVALLAGSGFGRYGEGFLRISYANSTENILEAVSRIADFLARRPAAGR
jgi:aspartate/methionine/tyrosine aminotransferase